MDPSWKCSSRSSSYGYKTTIWWFHKFWGDLQNIVITMFVTINHDHPWPRTNLGLRECFYKIWLVVGNMFFMFPYIGNFIIPTDFHRFQRGWKIYKHWLVVSNMNFIFHFGGCSIDELTRCHFGSSPGHRLSFLLQPSNGRWGRRRVEGPGQEKTTTRRVWRDWNPSEISPEEETTATRNRGWIPSDNPGGCET